jgi:uncharacterized protein YbjT (DUF2867 family)
MIAVVGGTGTVGARAVEKLAEAGVEVRILSRNAPDTLPPGATHVNFDMTADDPAAHLAGVDALVDLANSSSRPKRLLVEGTSRLLEACATSGTGHYVGISIVGCDQVGLGYYRAKARQEELIRTGPVPWSLLQTTQFHELIDRLMTTSARLGMLPAGSIRLQPVASAEVGDRLCQMALAGPRGGSERLVGPEVSTLGELATTWKSEYGRRLLTVPLPAPGRTGRSLREGAFTDPDAPTAGPSFAQWLDQPGG